LIKKIYANLRPKTLNGVEMNGRVFADLITEYVNSLNKEGLPQINSSWARVIETEAKRVLQSAKEQVHESL